MAKVIGTDANQVPLNGMLGKAAFQDIVSVPSGGTGTTTSTGTGSVVLSNSPSLVAPSIGSATGNSLITTGTITGMGGIKFSDTVQPTYKVALDFASDLPGTWRKLVTISLANQQYSTHGFRIQITDPKANHATQSSVSVDETIYYVACVRTEALTLDTPDLCVVRGPAQHIRAVKLSTGAYEIQAQPLAQYREYLITIDTYANNGAHTITYSNGSTSGSTGTATYTATTGSSTTLFDNISVSGNSAVTGTSVVTGLLTANSGLFRNTVNGPAYWLQQDGTGRNHWYWNTSGGTVPTFTNAAEDASSLSLSATANGSGGSFFHRSANGVGKNAGDAITWTTTIYSDLTNFSWKGSEVLHAANYTNYTVPKTGGTFTGTVSLENLSYSGTLTGGTGVVNIGSGQVYKNASGNLGVATTSPAAKLDVSAGTTAAPTYPGSIRTIGGGDALQGGFELLSSNALNGYGWKIFGPDYTLGNVPLVISSRTNSATWTERLRLDVSGNLGLGVTPSAWGSSQRAIEVGAFAALANDTTGNGLSGVMSNLVLNGTTYTYKLASSAYAGAYLFSPGLGQHQWLNTSTAGVGPATATLTQAMTLDASGNLNIANLTASKAVFTDASKNLTSTGTLNVDQGGTGATTLTGVLKGNGTSAFTAATAGTDYVSPTGTDGVITRQMLKDTGFVYFNSSTTNALDFTNGSHQRWTPATGAQTLSITNWPPTGNLGELLIEGVNLAAATITWPTINWIKSDGTTTTTFSSNGVTLQSSGTDFVFLWTRDAGTTIYGKIIR